MTRPVVLAAGGTGGHMFPALAVGAELRGRGLDALIVCDRRGARFLAPGSSHRIIRAASPAGSLRRKLAAGLALLWGTIQSIALFLHRRPLLALCFGGYAAVPVWLAARLLGTPVVVHEQNAVLGRTNRSAAASARLLALTFEQTREVPDGCQARTIVTGNPVRAPVRERAGAAYEVPAKDGPLRLLVVGGSQGARSLSDVLPGALGALPDELRTRLALTQQCRPEDLERVRRAYQGIGFSAVLESFFHDLPERLATSHLVISRSGASSVAEILALGRPSILVPYRHAADDHQRANAEALAGAGAAWILLEDELEPERLATLLARLIASPELLVEAARRARGLARPDAAEALVDALLPIIGHGASADQEAIA